MFLQSKGTIILFGIIFLVFLFLVIFILIQNNAKTTNTQSPEITPTKSQLPVPTIPTQNSGLSILTVEPNDQDRMELSAVSPITLSFSKQVNKSTFSIQTTPQIAINVAQKGDLSKIIITPQTYWKPNIPYTIQITNVESVDGSSLKLPYSLQFQALNTSDEENSSNVESSNNP